MRGILSFFATIAVLVFLTIAAIKFLPNFLNRDRDQISRTNPVSGTTKVDSSQSSTGNGLSSNSEQFQDLDLSIPVLPLAVDDETVIPPALAPDSTSQSTLKGKIEELMQTVDFTPPAPDITDEQAEREIQLSQIRAREALAKLEADIKRAQGGGQ